MPIPRAVYPGLTVGELRRRLDGVPDDLPVTIRTNDDWGCAGGILSVSIELTHDADDTPHLAVDCSDDENDFDEAAIDYSADEEE